MIGSRTVAVLCLLALALPLHHRLVEADRGDSTKEKKSQRDKCHDPIKETPGNNPHGSNYPCPLTNQLRYYATCDCVEQHDAPGSFGFNAADKQALLDFIASLEVQLEGFGGDINDSCVVDVGLSIEVFLESHVNIRSSISFLTMNDSSGVFWGTFQDYINVYVEIQFEVCGPVLVVESDGDCQMSKDIKEAAAANGNQKIIDECHNATMHINSMLKKVEFNVTEQLSFIYQILIEQCSEETIVFLSEKCHIANFGSFRSMLNVCKVNYRIQRMNVYMSGSTNSDCDFLNDLQAVWDATCFQGSHNNSVCGTLVNLIDKIKLRISTSVEIEFRMEMCANDIWDFCKLTPWICSIGLPRGGCTLSDFAYCSGFCHNEGCCDWNSPPPELPDCSCESGSGSGETVTPPECDGSGPCESGESPTPPGCDGSGPCESGESPTPPGCDGSGPCESGESPTPPGCDGSGPCESGESPTPPGCDGSGPCESGETTPAESAETTQGASVPPASTPGASVPPASTPRATTPAPATTTTPVSHCEDRARIIQIDASCNCSSLLLSITKVTNTWVFAKKQSVSPVINQIQQILYSKKPNAQKILEIFQQLDGYHPTTASWRVDFFSITIYESNMVTVWGTLGDFFTCGSSCTCASG